MNTKIKDAQDRLLNGIAKLAYGPFAYLDFDGTQWLHCPIIAHNPLFTLEYSKCIRILERGQKKGRYIQGTNPFVFFDDFISTKASGLLGIGYLGYNLRHFSEVFPPSKPTTFPFPKLFFAFFDYYYSINWKHLRITLHAITKEGAIRGRNGYKKILNTINNKEKYWSNEQRPSHNIVIKFNMTKSMYIHNVQNILDHIYKGDVYQVNLSRELFAVINNPKRVFSIITKSYGMPYQAYLHIDNNRQVLLNSPELFVSISPQREITTAPIKGTIRRSIENKKDSVLASKLMKSNKDSAEHLMIVDVERNDLGRICEIGSVKTSNLFGLKTFPGIHHIETVVSGNLLSNLGAFEAISKIFPGGSITGAPKIMAMNIISELEPTERNVYTGAFGVIFKKNIRLSLVIRSAMCFKNTICIPSGGGIVADSNPVLELKETIIKSQPFLKAIRAE